MEAITEQTPAQEQVQQRVCTTCRLVKSLDEFRPKKGGKHGKDSRCEPCRKIWIKEVYHKQPGVWARQQESTRRHVAKKTVFLEQSGITAKEKLCGQCHVLKPTSSYHVCIGNKDHLHLYCKDCRNLDIKLKLRQIRKEVIERYGGRCQCLPCGETRLQFLCIDHINGGGIEHRRNMKAPSIYVWLKRNNCPTEEFRVLCFNCNSAKGFYGYCHEEPTLTITAK